MPSFAPHIAGVPGSGIRRIHEIAVQLDDVIMLAVGEPDVPVAPRIRAAASAAWERDDTDYSPNGGVPQLRDAIASRLRERHGVDVEREQVWVTIGATQAVFLALQLTLAPGDELLVPDPGYTTFTMGARLVSAHPVPYTLTVERGFLPSIDELERLVTDRTRTLIVNTPSNPLGRVFPRETLEELVAFAARHDLWIVSDEVYEAFTYGAEHVSTAALDDEHRVLTALSFSKTFAMTGARVGALIVPPGLTETMRRVMETTVSCVSTPAQHAAVAALEGDQSEVAAAAEHYRGNLEAVAAVLDERGIRYLAPGGAFYLWIDVSHASGGDVAAWAEAFLLHDRVAVAPGSAFGRSGEGWIRICLAASRADLLEGVSRLPAPPRGEVPPAG